MDMDLSKEKLKECRNIMGRFFQMMEASRAVYQTDVVDVVVTQNEKLRVHQQEQQNPRQRGRKPTIRKRKNGKLPQADEETVVLEPEAEAQQQLSSIKEEEENSEPHRKSRRIAAKKATELSCYQLNQSLSAKLRNPGPSLKGSSSAGSSTSRTDTQQKPEKLDVALPECVVKLSRCFLEDVQQSVQVADRNSEQSNPKASGPCIPEIRIEPPTICSNQSFKEDSKNLFVDENNATAKLPSNTSSSELSRDNLSYALNRTRRLRSVNKKYNNDDFLTSDLLKEAAIPKTFSEVDLTKSVSSRDNSKREVPGSVSSPISGPSTSSAAAVEQAEESPTKDSDVRPLSDEKPRRPRTKKRSRKSRRTKLSKLAKTEEVNCTDTDICTNVLEDHNNEKENRTAVSQIGSMPSDSNLKSPLKNEALMSMEKKKAILQVCSAVSEKKLKPLIGDNQLLFSPLNKGGVLLKNVKSPGKRENFQTPLQKTLSAQKCHGENKQESQPGPSRTVASANSAFSKKQKVLQVCSENAKRKREEKEQRLLNMRRMLEEKEQARLERIRKEKLEKDQQMERAKKLKEEQILLKKQNAIAALKEAEERRLREEEAKQARLKKLEEEKKKKEKERLKMAEEAKRLHDMRQAQEAKEKQLQEKLKKAEKKNEKLIKHAIEEECSGSSGKKEPQPKNPKDENDYGISDIDAGDSTDDENVPKKVIPKWAQKKERMEILKQQHYINNNLTTLMFPVHVQTEAMTASNPRCRKRASSAIWDSPSVSCQK